jgi:hypothetical protein
VFRGAGGLSKAVQEIGGRKDVDLALRMKDHENIDVGSDNDFSLLLSSRPRWLHGAPPCKTFSRARRNDMVANVRCLRTEERPQGFGSEATDVANKLALRMLELARGQMKRGEFFSIENPFSSLMWKLKQYVKLAGEENVRMVRVHQCMAGSMHKKETGVLTNAPWIVDLLCDIESRPHHHVPLMGLVNDFRGEDSKRVFYTELAAEYPEGLCSMWATSFYDYCRNSEERRTPQSAEPGVDRPRQRTSLDGELVMPRGAELKRRTSQSTDPGVDRRRQRTSLDGELVMPRGAQLKQKTARSAGECLDGPSGSGTTGAASSRVLPRWRDSVVPTTQGLPDGESQAAGEEDAARGGEASEIQRGDPLVTARAGK